MASTPRSPAPTSTTTAWPTSRSAFPAGRRVGVRRARQGRSLHRFGRSRHATSGRRVRCGAGRRRLQQRRDRRPGGGRSGYREGAAKQKARLNPHPLRRPTRPERGERRRDPRGGGERAGLRQPAGGRRRRSRRPAGRRRGCAVRAEHQQRASVLLRRRPTRAEQLRATCRMPRRRGWRWATSTATASPTSSPETTTTRTGVASEIWLGSRSPLSGKPAVITQRTDGVPGDPAPGDKFGSGVAIGEVTGDRWRDIVVTAPADESGVGSVTVIPGSRKGADPAGAQFAVRPSVPVGAVRGRAIAARLRRRRPSGHHRRRRRRQESKPSTVGLRQP